MLDTKAGPLPELSVSRPGPIPSLDRIDRSKTADAASGRLLSDLQTGFNLLVAISVPFIVYVLSWKAGFDLSTVTYTLLSVVMACATLLSWETTRALLPEAWIAAVSRTRRFKWVALQTIPLVGFELWRHASQASIYVLVPLLAITGAFVATVGQA